MINQKLLFSLCLASMAFSYGLRAQPLAQDNNLIAPVFPLQEESAPSAPPVHTTEPPVKTPAPATRQTGTPSADLVDDKIIALIREKIQTELVVFMTNNQNKKYSDVDDTKITELDTQWTTERETDNKPLISATLTNPLSAYLTMVQAHSYGLFTEIFVMDDKGMNVGQSDISSDYWQGDEAKWQKTFLQGPEAIFIDEPEFDENRKIWIAQTSLSLRDDESGKAIGAVTVDVNLTELQRRLNASAQL